MNTEADIIATLKAGAKTGPSEFHGTTIVLDNWIHYGTFAEAPYADGTTVIDIESVAAGKIFLEVTEVKITGRTLWSDAKRAAYIDGPAVRAQVTITTDEGETFETLSGYIK